MSDYDAGAARRAGGRRIAPGAERDEGPDAELVDESQVLPGTGRRRRDVPQAEPHSHTGHPLPETSDGGPSTGHRASHAAPVPVDSEAEGAWESREEIPGSTGGRRVAVAAAEPRTRTSPAGRTSRWPFTESGQTASTWVAPLAGPDAPRPLTYNERLQLSRRRAEAAARAEGNPSSEPASVSAPPVAVVSTPVRELDDAPEPVASTTPVAVPTADPAPTPALDPAVVPAAEPRPPAPAPAGSRVADTDVAPRSRRRRFFAGTFVLLWLAAVVVSAGQLAEAHDLWTQPEDVTRIGSVAATWLALVLLARRTGGRYILIAVFSGVVLGLVAAYPENWALAGAGVTAASVHGVLGMTLTRPAKGLRTLRELLISAVIGAAGAVVVTGYDVVLRPFRFRVMVLTLVLVGCFLLAWRLGQGASSIGRRGIVLIGGGVALLVASVAYTQAIRAWGSPEVVTSVTDLKDSVEARLGAVPRPIEALVGFPALVWGVTIRSRRRQGWWMCAFGSLGAAGVATSLIQPATPFVDSVAATGYDIVIGGVVGLVLVLLDQLLTGRGRRAAADATAEAERPEPPRFSPLL